MADTTFVFTIESEQEGVQTLRLTMHNISFQEMEDSELRLRSAVKGLRKQRPFKDWRVVHVWEETLPML